jgi:hypothetical protein
MNWNFVMAIIRKDFMEFKKNKYILYTLVTFPIVFAIIMPLSIITPILLVGDMGATNSEPGGPPTLNITHDLNQSGYDQLNEIGRAHV